MRNLLELVTRNSSELFTRISLQGVTRNSLEFDTRNSLDLVLINSQETSPAATKPLPLSWVHHRNFSKEDLSLEILENISNFCRHFHRIFQ